MRILLGILMVMLMGCGSAEVRPPDAEAGAQGEVRRTLNGAEVEYRYEKSGCSVSSEHRDGVPSLRLRFACADADEFMNGFTAIVQAWKRASLSVSSLALGRIDAQILGGPLALSRELARASHASAGWDRAKGTARSGGANVWVEKALPHLPSIKSLLSRLKEAGFEVAGFSVEKVRWTAGEDDPVLRAESLSGKLAWDALLYLKLRTVSQAR